MTTTNKISYSGLARRLVLDGLLRNEEAEQASKLAYQRKTPFVSYLVENEILNAVDIAHAAAQDFGVPLLDLDHFNTSIMPIDLINDKLIKKHHALPLYKRGNRLYIALSDPTNLNALDEIKFYTGINTYSVLVEEDKLDRAIDSALTQTSSSITEGLDDISLDELDIEKDSDEEEEKSVSDVDDAPIIRFVNKVLLDAINKNASDIHFEPYEKIYRIRFRIDGILYEMVAPPLTLASKISSRLKIMSHLDISERRLPQDGHIKLKLSRKRAIDFRVNSCPTVYGEKIVLRILDPETTKMGIDSLGFEPKQKALFLNAINKPQGMVLVTGPTGSGKTVTLYTGINLINTTETNISTAEDPVELPLPGVNQVNVNIKTGLTFPESLRAFLRQDPDVIMVGEIRDLETASIAVKASQTGHLVLSTLHTNSAPETLNRMVNMGIEPFNIATSVTLIIAQRLLRCLCNDCKVERELPPKQVLLDENFTEEEIPSLKLFQAVGCSKCTKGYTGRTGIYEVLPMTTGLGRIIMEGGNVMDIINFAKSEGFQSLRRSAINKVISGITSLEEANRVTKD